ncbi:MAG: thioredoxin family protein, partial [Chloroflexi bacterium]|nr:thioredoxin family protein [Chloroflexota bacterium]
KYGITSTPGIVINDRLAYQGTINEERLRRLLAKVV